LDGPGQRAITNAATASGADCIGVCHTNANTRVNTSAHANSDPHSGAYGSANPDPNAHSG